MLTAKSLFSDALSGSISELTEAYFRLQQVPEVERSQAVAMVQSHYDQVLQVISSQTVASQKLIVLSYQYETRLAFYFRFDNPRINPEIESKERFLNAIRKLRIDVNTAQDWAYRRPSWAEFLAVVQPALFSNDFYTQVSFLTDHFYGLPLDSPEQVNLEKWINRSGLLEEQWIYRYDRWIADESSRWFKSAARLRVAETQLAAHRTQAAECITAVRKIFVDVCQAIVTLTELKKQQSTLFRASHYFAKSLVALEKGLSVEEFLALEGMQRAMLYERVLKNS